MLTTLLLTVALIAQDKPTDIPKAQLPKAAECVVCSAGGAGHEEEKPAAGVMYKGKPYYFCNAKEIAGFKKDPESFIPLPLPRPMAKFDLVDTYGNVRVCTAFLYGLATEDLDSTDLAFNDPWFPLIHCVRAVKHSDRPA